MNRPSQPYPVDELGACRRCLSRIEVDGQLHCTDRLVRGPLASVPCIQARSRDGGCGWEALRMHWPAIGQGPTLRAAA